MGWCPWCKIFSYGEEPHNGGPPVCHVCKWKLEPGDLADIMDLLCDRCAKDLEYRSPCCEYCGALYFDDYWDSLDDVLEEHGVEPEDTDDVIDGSEVYDVTFCCAKDANLCICAGGPVLWEDAQHMPKNMYENIYPYNSKCSGCRFFYTPQCIPFRAWVTDYVQWEIVNNFIDICSYYDPEPSCI